MKMKTKTGKTRKMIEVVKMKKTQKSGKNQVCSCHDGVGADVAKGSSWPYRVEWNVRHRTGGVWRWSTCSEWRTVVLDMCSHGQWTGEERLENMVALTDIDVPMAGEQTLGDCQLHAKRA